jgi:hypothetical protein
VAPRHAITPPSQVFTALHRGGESEPCVWEHGHGFGAAREAPRVRVVPLSRSCSVRLPSRCQPTCGSAPVLLEIDLFEIGIDFVAGISDYR